MKKRRLVKFQTPKGEKALLMEPVVNISGPEEVICETRCPYSKICKLMPDPRDPEGSQKLGFDGFLNFCGDLGTAQLNGENDEQAKGDVDLANYVPAPGSIEDTFEDFPGIFNVAIQANPIVRVKDVIEHACKGWCPDWSEDYHNCNSGNMTCILRNLFINQKAVENSMAHLKEFEADAEKKSEELTKDVDTKN